MKSKRKLIQTAFVILTNSNFSGFLTGQVYSGGLKRLCAPGLNCYACPGALGSCPIGAMQNSLGDPIYRFSFYATGFLALFGVLFGRMICGFLCPFGLIEELLYMPAKHIKRRFPPAGALLEKNHLHPIFRYLKYAILLLFVILLPLFALDSFGFGIPWFCKYICPSGMVMGASPVLSAQPGLLSLTGWIFYVKLAVCALIILFSMISHRFFCKYLCPLGAVYGLFNGISFYRMSVDTEKCVSCGECGKLCPMGVRPNESPNSAECIRCGSCVDKCPHNALCASYRCYSSKPSTKTIN
ncbi:MAG: 4Fe-4S binding protein [Clostridiales Family XIII bacterium]|nr:4Fe-4S binding protein [Clostridiales Family XIII bacterium]